MKKNIVLYRVFAAAAVLALILAAIYAPDSGGSVLCVGADGHTAREASVNGVCASDALAWHHEGSTRTAGLTAGSARGSHCGPCTDIQMLSATRVVNPQSRAMFIPIQSVALVAYTYSDVPAVEQLLGGANLNASPCESFMIRSVSLRI